MDSVRFNGVYRIIPQFSHSRLIPDDLSGELTHLLNRWVDGQNSNLATKQDSFSRQQKAEGRKINPIEAKAIEALDPSNLNRVVLWVTNDKKGNDLADYQFRVAPFASYSRQNHSYDYSDIQAMGVVHQDFASRAINQGVYLKKPWFKEGSRLQATVKEEQSTTAKPNFRPSEVVFRQPTPWERYWMS